MMACKPRMLVTVALANADRSSSTYWATAAITATPAFPSTRCATSSSPAGSRSTAYPFSRATRRQPSVNGTETTSSAAAAHFFCPPGGFRISPARCGRNSSPRSARQAVEPAQRRDRAAAAARSHGTPPSLEHDDRADRFAARHQVEALVDAVERQSVGDQRVDLDLLVHVPVDDLRHVGAAARAAERRALPDAAGDELEWPRRDLLAGAGDADDDRDAPALVAAFQRLAHQRGGADAFEDVIGAALCQARPRGHEVARDLLGIDEMRHAGAFGDRLAAGIDVHADAHVRPCDARAPDHIHAPA